MDKLNLSSIIQRIKSKTPPFWKKIRALMITCGAIGGGISALPVEQIVWLPHSTGGVLVVIGVVGTSLSSLTANPEVDRPNT